MQHPSLVGESSDINQQYLKIKKVHWCRKVVLEILLLCPRGLKPMQNGALACTLLSSAPELGEGCSF